WLAILPRVDDFRCLFVGFNESVGVVSIEEGYPHILAVNLGRNKSNRRSPPRNKEADNTADHEKEHRYRNDLRNVGVLVLCDCERNGGGEEKNEQDTTGNPPRARRPPTLVTNRNVQHCNNADYPRVSGIHKSPHLRILRHAANALRRKIRGASDVD